MNASSLSPSTWSAALGAAWAAGSAVSVTADEIADTNFNYGVAQTLEELLSNG